MRRSGLWHPRLAALVTAMGHHETVVVADPGLPVPAHVEAIDLLWTRGNPPLLPVLEALCAELVLEEAVIAEELTDAAILAGLDRHLVGVPVKTTTHEDLKAQCHSARAIVRTGEATAYANVILRAGVAF